MPDRFTRTAASRRAVLKSALAGLAGAALAPLWRTSLSADAAQIVRVTDELALITGVGGNVLVRATDAGQVLVDSGAAASSAALRAALAGLPGAGRAKTLINTHWHLDQIGSNAALGGAGAAIIAHEKTRAHLATDYYLPAEDRYEKALPKEGQPTETFYTRGEMTIDNDRIDYGYLLEAHTDGDIYVFFRDANVIAVGDAVSPERDPELDWFGGGWLGGRVDALALLLEISDERTRFVPSFGPVITRADVQAEHELMLALFERMVELVRQGLSAEDILDAGVMTGLSRSFEDPLRFVYSAHKGLWAHHNTLSPDVV
jgi:glyoxylase-like metal-dependent hydrolase (beta-lactamase superfamily II)